MTFQDSLLALSSKLAGLSSEERQKLVEELRQRQKGLNPEKVAEKIQEEIFAHPAWKLTQEFIKSEPSRIINGERRLPITTVESVIAEKMSWAYAMTLENGRFLTDDPAPSLNGSVGRQNAAAFMLHAVPYVWVNEMFRLVVSSELPRHTIAARVPFNSVWFTFENGIEMNLDAVYGPKGEGKKHADGLLAIQLADRLRIVVLGSSSNQIPFCIMGDVFQGTIYPDEVPAVMRQTAHYVLSCLSFINSPYIVLEKRGICRQARRRIGMEGEVQESNVARFITLRAPLYKRDHQESHSDIDWKFRWLVRGHHRAQWCPSTRDHKLMWIAPYVKGPEGMPMKTTAYKVVR